MKDSTSRIIAIIIIAATGLLVGGLAVLRVTGRSGRHIDVDREEYPVWGVDLSAHNGRPDFDSIAYSGASFAYLKASEGTDFRDRAFIRNYAAGKLAGLPVGAYHFFRFDCDGYSQALNLLGAVAGCRLDLPLAIDIEESGNPAQVPTALIVERLRSMVESLQRAGYNVLIYTNKNGDARFVRSHFDDLDGGDPELWICSFTNPPINRRPWRLWQNSHISTVPGVVGNVDVNTFNGSREEWARWLVEQRPSSAD